jgi:hypothetical protein
MKSKGKLNGAEAPGTVKKGAGALEERGVVLTLRRLSMLGENCHYIIHPSSSGAG